MTQPTDLAEVLAAHRPSAIRCYPMKCRCGAEYTDFPAHQARAWREACTITTVEHLDALPVLSAVLPMWYRSLVCFRYYDGWYVPLSDTPVYPLGDASSGKTCLLLWHPGWA